MAKMLEGKHAQDWINLFLAVILFISPWVLGFATEQYASWNAWISGAVVGLVAIGAIGMFNEWEEWLNLLVGIWVIAAPWVLGFAAVTAAMSAHVVLGFLIAASAAWEIWEIRHGPQVTA
jgi:hypothetical protein